MRELHFEQAFVPLLDEYKAKKIIKIPDIGMQVSGGRARVHPHMIVIMGELCQYRTCR